MFGLIQFCLPVSDFICRCNLILAEENHCQRNKHGEEKEFFHIGGRIFVFNSHEQTETAAASQMKVSAAGALPSLQAPQRSFRSAHGEGVEYWQKWPPARVRRRR